MSVLWEITTKLSMWNILGAEDMKAKYCYHCKKMIQSFQPKTGHIFIKKKKREYIKSTKYDHNLLWK